MKSESLNDPNSPDGHESLENATPKPQTNGGEGDIELKADGKPPRASHKRLIQSAAAETEVLPVTQPYFISTHSMNGDYQRRPDESFGSDVRATLLLLREKIWLIILCVLMAANCRGSFLFSLPSPHWAPPSYPVQKEARKNV